MITNITDRKRDFAPPFTLFVECIAVVCVQLYIGGDLQICVKISLVHRQPIVDTLSDNTLKYILGHSNVFSYINPHTIFSFWAVFF